MIGRRASALLAMLAAPACTSATAPASDSSSSSSETTVACPVDVPPRIELVDPLAFTQDAAADPYPAHRPAGTPDCESGFWEEYGTFEIDTTLCGYASFSQPALADVPACSLLELSILHDPLIADQPAVAHVAVAAGGTVIWESEVPIPSPYGHLYATDIEPPAIVAGMPIQLHLHNHGTNQYRFVSLAAMRQP